MRLFVSYSRSDAQFVGRLTEALEAEGHDVWVDTEDIAGSEQWRASIVAGVQRAEAVLLVVSPRSMTSPNVEREVTVAAEEGRRIVPLVFEPAEMTGSILFVLAGAQQILFANRDFDVAMADLRDELSRLSAQPAAVAQTATPVQPPSRRDNRRMAAVAVVGLALVAAVIYLVTRRGDSNDAQGSPQTAASVGEPTSDAVTATAPASLSVVPLGATVWFAGFQIGTTQATFNPVAGVVEMEVTFTNDAIGAADPLGMLESGSGALEWSGGRVPAFCSCSTQLPAGNKLPATMEFDVPADFDVQSAVFVLGGATQHQAKIPLGGGAPTSDQPVPYDVRGQIDDGAGTTFTIERVRVVPAECSGLASDLTYVPGSVDRVSVEVVGTAVYTGEGTVGFGDAT
ncbi:MAG TPA: toll/interleukin-1 receptor domain-containing protein, partial [Ilumatobacteraceae bacterium]